MRYFPSRRASFFSALEVCGRFDVKTIHRFRERVGFLTRGARNSMSSSSAGPAGRNVRVAHFDLRAYRRVTGFEVALQFVGVHNAGNGNAVLFEDEVFLIYVITHW